MASSVHNTVLWPYPPMYYCDHLHLGNVLHVSIFHNSNYWQKNLTKNRTRGFGFSDAKCQCIASFCPRGFFFSANYADTGSAIFKEQAQTFANLHFMKRQTSKARTVLAKVHCTPMFTSTKHNRDSKKCQQAQTYLHTHRHTALAEQPGKHKHTHTRTPAAHTSTYAALCTRTSTSTFAPRQAQGELQ